MYKIVPLKRIKTELASYDYSYPLKNLSSIGHCNLVTLIVASAMFIVSHETIQ